MQKKLIIIIFILTITSILGVFYVGKKAIQSRTGDTVYDKIAKKIPDDLREKIKEKFFKNDYLKQQIYLKDKLIKELIDKENKKNQIIYKNYDKIYFNKIFSKTEVVNEEKFKFINMQTFFLSNPKNDYAIASGYLDIYKDYLIVVSGDGIIFRIKLKNLQDIKENLVDDFFGEIIDSNFKEINKNNQIYERSYHGIKDVLIHKDKILISYTKEIRKNCYNTGILIGNLDDKKKIQFQEIDYSSECAHKDTMDVSHSGGRMVSFSDNEIIFTSGDYFQEYKVQNINSIFGKIIKINLDDSSYEIISLGHRNPQGLKYVKEKSILISTEHGPIGGDEINIINLNKNLSERNYGWPIASYGIGEQINPSNIIDNRKLYKSHENFVEPILQFTPSIGISEISKFFDENNNKYLVSSLGTKLIEGDMSIHYLEINNSYDKILKNFVIPVDERIRDIVYSKLYNYYILFLESDRYFKGGPSLSILYKE